ncbi:MAG: hydrogenase maturation nickel metallochaperone HypA [Nitrososphaerota archaeon]|nr:hydrogenase maturation nickel metallochaperone HypA [Aigarchaeota archaeon]MDW8076482.1 hydrogenase maturation nickel metallochaperone HypA [Nitrososphaerota archaeon]
MHEFSVVLNLIEKVVEEAKKRDAKRVIEVELDVGQLSFLNPEQMRFAYNVLSKDTILENSNLIINTVDARVRCGVCGFDGKPDYADDASYHISAPLFLCPICGNPVEVIEGKGCIIKRVRLEL